MEKNNDPSTSSGTNKNQNVKELTDEQLKEVAGGIGLKKPCPLILNCKTQARYEPCGCQECEDGYVLWTSSRGIQECELDLSRGTAYAY